MIPFTLPALAHPAATPTWPPAKGEVEWASVAVVSHGERVIEEERVLRVAPADGDAFSVRTVSTRLRIEGPEGVTTFDSSAPTDADPWPLLLNHLVSTAPARVEWREGQLRLTDPVAWSDAAQDALLRASLPPSAIATADELLDPVRFEQDLQRWFPGPLVGDNLERDEHFGGVDAHRVESCSSDRERGLTVWQCDGTASEPGGRLLDSRTWTRLEVDRRGLSAAESGYDGVIDLRSQGRGLVAVAGRRRTERREPR